MADGLTRRQGRARIRQRHDIETGLRTEDDASRSSDEDSLAPESYGNSRCIRMISSHLCSSSLRGRVLKWERHCYNTAGAWYERIKETNFLENYSATMSRFNSFRRLYFTELQESLIPSPTVTTEMDEEEFARPLLNTSQMDEENFVTSNSDDNWSAASQDDLEHTKLTEPITVSTKNPRTPNVALFQSPLKPDKEEEDESFIPDSLREFLVAADLKLQEEIDEMVDEDDLKKDSPPQSVEELSNVPDDRSEKEMKAKKEVLNDARVRPKLIDYSKSSAPLPSLSPDIMAKLTHATVVEEYTQELKDDEEQLFEGEIDDSPDVESRQTEPKVHFLLRVPKSKFRNGRSENNPDSAAEALARGSLHSRLSRSGRRRSVGSESTDFTPTAGVFGSSRRNSEDPLNLSDSNGIQNIVSEMKISPAGTPESINRSIHNYQLGHPSPDDEIIPRRKMRRSSFVAGSKIEHFDGTRSNPRTADPTLEYEEFLHAVTNRRSSSSDEEMPRRRANRRSSFVAGSKIERFDGNGGRKHMRRASMSTTSSGDFSIGYNKNKPSPRSPKGSESSYHYVGLNDSFKKLPS